MKIILNKKIKLHRILLLLLFCFELQYKIENVNYVVKTLYDNNELLHSLNYLQSRIVIAAL